MSYTYLQAQGEESSAGCFSDIPAYVLSRLNLTPEKPSYKDSGTECCQNSQSGMTSKPLTEILGEGLSMSSAAASHARISVLLVKGQELMAPDPGFGQNLPESLAKYDPDSHSWKTHQHSLLGGLAEFSGPWPRWGTMRSGELFPLLTPVLRTYVKESGFWHTPIASDWGQRRISVNSRGEPKLAMQALLFPSGNPPCLEKQREFVKQARKQIASTSSINHGGRLNPDWTEWLMGWPTGWTGADPLGMGKFQQWQLLHGIS